MARNMGWHPRDKSVGGPVLLAGLQTQIYSKRELGDPGDTGGPGGGGQRQPSGYPAATIRGDASQIVSLKNPDLQINPSR